jgi:hypothetical protein
VNGSITTPQNGLNGGGYSATVRLWVTLDDEKIDVGQVGGGKLYFDEPRSLKAGQATLTIEIDGDPVHQSIKILPEPTPSCVVRYER